MIGFKDPIVIDKQGEIKAGHGRLLAAQELGMTRVPYIPLEGLTKKQMDMFMYMDNQVNESPWIDDNVQSLLQDMPETILENYDVNWDDIITAEPEEETEEIPEPPAIPKSKRGEVYQLGKHRIMCGDCTSKESISRLLVDCKFDLLLTDPPYGVDMGNKNEFLNELSKSQGHAGNRITKEMANDNIDDYMKFFKSFLELVPFNEKSVFYIFMSDQKLRELLNTLHDLKFKMSNILIWNKNSAGFGRKDYHSKHENIVYGWKNTHKFYTNYATTVLDFDKPLFNKLHPTMKPLELISQIITNSTKKNMTVYDPFLGSGSTLIACEQTNRICYGMELDPAYIDVIITRWENYTGKKAKLLK